MAGFLAAAGAEVVLVARRKARLAEAAEAIRADGGSASYVVGDLLQREGLPDLAGRCKAMTGASVIDGVVNAAGINPRVPAEEVTLEAWDRTLNLNLAAPFFFTREFVPAMKAQSFGRVINVASIQALRAFPDGVPYGASKGGVAQLTRAMAEAWSSDGIMCNAIAPGFVPTELAAPVFENEEYRNWTAAQTAVGRNSDVDDLVGITIFLASEASAYATGQVFFIDGGFTAT